MPHELIRWTSRRSDQIAACLAELEHEYVTAVDDDGEPKFLPAVSERARAKLNQIAARKTRPPKQKTQPLAQLRAWWKTSAILTSRVAIDVINSLLEYARAATAAIRARFAAVVDVALAAVDVTATVFVMNDGGRFHRRHLLTEARRRLALVLRGRRRDPGLDDRIVAAAISTYCQDISEPRPCAAWSPATASTRPVGPVRPPRPPPPTNPRARPGRATPGRSRCADCAPAPGPEGGGAGDTPRPAELRPGRPRPRGGAGEAAHHKHRHRRAGPGVRRRRAPASGDALAVARARATDPEHDDQEPEAGRGEAIDLMALRALRESRTDVEALDLIADRLRHLQDAFTKAGDDSRSREDRYAEKDDADAHSVQQDDQQTHHPQTPGPHRGREAGH